MSAPLIDEAGAGHLKIRASSVNDDKDRPSALR
jgi:hypothetical protein